MLCKYQVLSPQHILFARRNNMALGRKCDKGLFLQQDNELIKKFKHENEACGETRLLYVTHNTSRPLHLSRLCPFVRHLRWKKSGLFSCISGAGTTPEVKFSQQIIKSKYWLYLGLNFIPACLPMLPSFQNEYASDELWNI